MISESRLQKNREIVDNCEEGSLQNMLFVIVNQAKYSILKALPDEDQFAADNR